VAVLLKVILKKLTEIVSKYFLISWGGLRLTMSPLGTSATIWPIVQAPDDECGVVGGMRIDRRNQSPRRKPAPVPLYPPQVPYDLTWNRTRPPPWECTRTL
jgi:hypothetical protein